MKRTCISLILILVMTATALIGCTAYNTTGSKDKAVKTSDVSVKSEEDEKMTDVTLNEVAHSIFYAPQYVAIEEGYFEEEGIKLNREFCTVDPARRKFPCCEGGDGRLQVGRSERKESAWRKKRRHAADGI